MKSFVDTVHKHSTSLERTSVDRIGSANIEKPFCGNVRKLLIMGLEGSGKTSLINNLCGTSYPTGTHRFGYRIVDNQRGSFKAVYPASEITLYDTNGLRIDEPGKWHEHLKSTLEINGVIFFIDGHDKRCSLHGDLPRLIEYCRNLELPILYLFRSEVVDWLDEKCGPDHLVHAKRVEKKGNSIDIAVYSQKDKDRIKRLIADRFASATTSRALIDPVQLATKMRELEKRHQQELTQLKNDHHQTVNQKDSSYDHLQRLYENDKKHFDDLKQNLIEAQKLCEDFKNRNETLSVAKRRLQQEIEELQRKEEDGLQTIRKAMIFLRSKVNDVAVPNINDDGKLRLRGKKHQCKKHKAWLPLMGLVIASDYDALADSIAELLNGIVSKLEEADGA